MARIIIGAVLVLWGLGALLGFSLFKFAFAVILIAIGVSMISGRRRWSGFEAVSASSEDSISEVAVFSPVNKKITSPSFRGGKLTMVFAGGEMDLSGAKAAGSSVELAITAIFGGAKLIVPKDWRVNVQGAAVLGGYDNKAASGGTVTLNLKGSMVFGGLEIVN